MTSIFRIRLLSAGIALALTATSAFAADSTATDVTEARQETQIWTTYALSPYLRASDIKVTVDNGKATLTGKVDESVNKDLAKQIALGVKGIKEVENNIVVEADYKPSHTETFGQTVDDTTITAAVKSKLAWSKYTDSDNISVETKLGRVHLKGSTDSAESKELAGRIAASTKGVVAVNNHLAVDTQKSSTGDKAKSTTAEAKKDIADSWITTKVKSTYLYSSNVSGSDIDVATNAGVVTLKGKVPSGVERALAVELAENVRGVKSVDAKGLTF